MYAEFATKVEKRFLHTLDLDTEVISSSTADTMFLSRFMRAMMCSDEKEKLTPISGFKDPDIEREIQLLYGEVRAVGRL